jgi:hypothetical protein
MEEHNFFLTPPAMEGCGFFFLASLAREGREFFITPPVSESMTASSPRQPGTGVASSSSCHR